MSTIKVNFVVDDIDAAIETYDVVEVQRSVEGPPYYVDAASVTAVSATPATVTGTNTFPFTGIGNRVLILEIGNVSVQVVFTSAAENIDQAVNQINTATNLVVASISAGRLKLSTVEVGDTAVLEVESGTALSILGLTADTYYFGLAAHIDLLPHVSQYEFIDYHSYSSAYYRMRYVDLGSSLTSDWSDWILAPSGSALQPTSTIYGTIALANIDGSVLSGAEVTIVNVFSPIIKDNYFIAGASITVTTGELGTARVRLIKGSYIDVIIEGTSIIRRIQVPSTGTEFNLLDPLLQVDDMFGIQQPDLPAAVRRTI
jgi:hypothetical protein